MFASKVTTLLFLEDVNTEIPVLGQKCLHESICCFCLDQTKDNYTLLNINCKKEIELALNESERNRINVSQ